MSYVTRCLDPCGNPSTPLPEWPPFWNGGTPIVPPDPILNIICPVSPVSAVVTAAPVTVLVSGTLFTPTTQATVNGAPQTTNVASASQLSFQLDPSAYTAGTILQIGVTDGGVVGMTTCPFEILSALILPTIVSVTPDYVGRDGPTKTLTVIGTNFVNAAPADGGSQVIYNVTGILPTTFVSATELTAVMDPDIVMVGGHQIRVANGPLTNRSPTYVVCNCVWNPTVAMMDITSVPSGGSTPTKVTVVGDNYGDTAKVLVDGVEVVTNRLSGGALEFDMPPEPAPVVRQISVRLGHDHPPPHGHDNVVVVAAPTSLPFTYT